MKGEADREHRPPDRGQLIEERAARVDDLRHSSTIGPEVGAPPACHGFWFGYPGGVIENE
jgi:hypothetical protein